MFRLIYQVLPVRLIVSTVFRVIMKRTGIVILLILTFFVACTSGDISPDIPANAIPHAAIDSIDPVESITGEPVRFQGHGTDLDGTVVSCMWRSSLDGLLSSEMGFSTSSLSTGEHLIYFRVQDNNGD